MLNLIVLNRDVVAVNEQDTQSDSYYSDSDAESDASSLAVKK